MSPIGQVQIPHIRVRHYTREEIAANGLGIKILIIFNEMLQELINILFLEDFKWAIGGLNYEGPNQAGRWIQRNNYK